MDQFREQPQQTRRVAEILVGFGSTVPGRRENHYVPGEVFNDEQAVRHREARFVVCHQIVQETQANLLVIIRLP